MFTLKISDEKQKRQYLAKKVELFDHGGVSLLSRGIGVLCLTII